MGIVLNQSFKNTLLTYFGFAIGGITTIFLFPVLLGATYYAVTNYLLSAANVIMPLFAIGMQNTLVKYFSQCKTELERNQFLSFAVLFPLALSVPLCLISLFFYDDIVNYVSLENPVVRPFIWLIPFIGFCMAYFEIFYAWLRVYMHSVFGNFIKEVGLRLLGMLGLLGLYLKIITPTDFVYFTAGVYLLALVVTVIYAFKIKKPEFHFTMPQNVKAILEYTFYIILSGSIANLLLDGDKLMLNQYMKIDNIAYYSVATYIALVISVPSRAMHQIVYPITAKLMHDNKYKELNVLYKKTSINLQVVGGFVMLCIFVNINQLYLLVPKVYSGGIAVVFIIGLSKYFELILGNNNAIIFNSKYYKMVLFLGLMLVFLTIVLNMFFIPRYGIIGSAIATLLSITVYSLAKLLFVIKRMKLYPFSKQTLYSILITVLLFLTFYFWSFNVYPIFGIIFKSILVGITYLFLNVYFKISPEINNVVLKLCDKLIDYKNQK